MGRLAKTVLHGGSDADPAVIALFAELTACVHKHGPLFGTVMRRVHYPRTPSSVTRRLSAQIIEMIGMETNRGRQAIDKPSPQDLGAEGSRATSPITP